MEMHCRRYLLVFYSPAFSQYLNKKILKGRKQKLAKDLETLNDLTENDVKKQGGSNQESE